MLSDRTRGILLQVAFKAAVDLYDKELSDETVGAVTDLTEELFVALVDLFNKYDITEESQSRTLTPPTPPVVNIDGEEYQDYRELKANGSVSPNHPDFKAVNGGKGFWLKTKDGKPTSFAKKINA